MNAKMELSRIAMGELAMLSPLIIGVIVFAVILTGTLAGWAVRRWLPPHHLTDETKNLVSVSRIGCHPLLPSAIIYESVEIVAL